MNHRNLALLIFATPILTSPSFARDKSGSSPCVVEYENHNQTDYGPLVVQKLIKGLVTDRQRSVVANACLGIFTENGHKLVATMESDSGGKFSQQNIAPGKYRIVVKVDTLCTANVPVRVAKSLKKPQMLHVHMEPRGIDSCSYADLEAESDADSQTAHIPSHR